MTGSPVDFRMARVVTAKPDEKAMDQSTHDTSSIPRRGELHRPGANVLPRWSPAVIVGL